MGIEEAQVLPFAERERKLELDIYEGERVDRIADRRLREADQAIALAKITAEKEVELARLESGQVIAPNGQSVTSQEPFQPINHLPQLVKYDENLDDLDCYLIRFNRFAETVGWSNEDKAVRLCNLLTGKALATAMRLDPK